MKDVKLIATDMDHTLLTEKGELPPDFLKYVCELSKLDVLFVIASGRPMYTLNTIFSELVNKLIFISDNGGAISYKNKSLFTSLISPEDYKEMVSFTKEKTTGVPILCGLESAFIERKDKKHVSFLKKFYAKITLVDSISMIDSEANKFTVYFPDEMSKKYYDESFNPIFSTSFSVTVGDTVWIDIMNKGIDKGQAIKIIGEKFDIQSSQMMAFGDTYNDIELLNSVKYSYIVENANKDMKQYAKYMTKSNDEYGVLHIVKKVIKEKLSEQ